MVQPYQGLGHMMLVHTVIEPVTAYLMLVTVIRDLAEVLVLAEVSVEAEAGAEVVVVVDLVIGNR